MPPLCGLAHQEDRKAGQIEQDLGAGAAETSTAQILRWYLGVLF